MKESDNEKSLKPVGTEINTFTVPFPLERITDDIVITSNLPCKISKKQIINKALNFHSEGNLVEAAKYYQYFIDQGFNDHRVFSNYGIILNRTGHLQKAESFQRKAIELKPNFADAHSNLGNILANIGKLKEAELSTRKAIELNPNFAMAYSNLGVILKDLGKLKEAELSTKKAIELDPDFADGHYNMGNIYRDLGNLEEAELSLRKAIKLNPDFENAHYNLVIILIYLGKLKEAELLTRTAVDIYPKSARMKLNLGICEYTFGKIDSSIKTLESANKIDPKDTVIKYLIAIFKGRKVKKYKNQRIEKIKQSLFEEKSSWNPLVLHREVEEELIKEIYKIKTKKAKDHDRYQPPIFGNTNGSNYNLFKSEIPIINKLKKDITAIVSEYFESTVYVTDSFFNIISPKDGIGGGNKIHNHLSMIDKIPALYTYKQKFSLVYYLSIGDQDCDEPGLLYFHKPSTSILPKKGMLIIFPASRLHSISYNGRKDRVIISINFYLI